MKYVLHYKEPGKRPGTTRQAKRPIDSIWNAERWLYENRDNAFLPATVTTKGWKPSTVAFFC